MTARHHDQDLRIPREEFERIRTKGSFAGEGEILR